MLYRIFYLVPVNVQDAETVPLTVSVNVSVPPAIEPAPAIVYELPHPSVKVCVGKTTLLPLAVPENVMPFTHEPLPTVPVLVTVLPLAVNANDDVPLPHELDPVHVPANCAPSLPLLLELLVHEDAVIIEIDTIATKRSRLLKILC